MALISHAEKIEDFFFSFPTQLLIPLTVSVLI